MLSASNNDILHTSQTPDAITISSLLTRSHLETQEQIRRFELLRLAFFTLKLRKLEQQAKKVERTVQEQEEDAFRSNLLHHAIFQQVLTLTKLDARTQALQLIEACRK